MCACVCVFVGNKSRETSVFLIEEECACGCAGNNSKEKGIWRYRQRIYRFGIEIYDPYSASCLLKGN